MREGLRSERQRISQSSDFCQRDRQFEQRTAFQTFEHLSTDRSSSLGNQFFTGLLSTSAARRAFRST
jgi:hypothetical protein